MKRLDIPLRTVFLVDGLGAVVSAVSSGVVLPLFSEQLGVPSTILYSLGCIAFGFSIYSLCCFKFISTLKPWMLLGVILANLSYCFAVGGMLCFLESVTFLGTVVLSFEILILILVVLVELSVYRKYLFSA